MNCGFRTRISGETDFPCIYGERVGLGRVYVKLDDGRLDFDRWCQGVKEGRSYVGDGRSHLIDFRVNDRGVGEAGSELKLSAPATVKVHARVAALLDPEPRPRRRPSASVRSTRSRTGISSEPASARAGRSRSSSSSTLFLSRGPRSSPMAVSRRGRLTCPSRSQAGLRCGFFPRRTPTRFSCSSATSPSALPASRPNGA